MLSGKQQRLAAIQCGNGGHPENFRVWTEKIQWFTAPSGYSTLARTGCGSLIPRGAIGRQIFRQFEPGVFHAVVDRYQLQDLLTVTEREHRFAVAVTVNIVDDRCLDQCPQTLAAVAIDEHAVANPSEVVAHDGAGRSVHPRPPRR